MPCSHHAPFIMLYVVALVIIWAYLGEAATATALLLSLLTWGFGRTWACPAASDVMFTPRPSDADDTPQDRSPA